MLAGAGCEVKSVVFLDIDGVLNTPEDYAKWSASDPQTLGPSDRAEYLFNPGLVERLNRITDATGAAIVVSSSWRFYYCGGPVGYQFEALISLFRKVGIKAPVVGPTPPTNHSRWDAIEEWIDNHDALGHLRYAVLDDDVPSAEWPWKRNHVHCRAFPGGLTADNEARAICLLMGDE